MKERSIILRAHEVLGALAGTRTQLRRPLAKQPPPECTINYQLGNESWMRVEERTPLRHSWEAWSGPLFDAKPAKWLCGRHEVVSPFGSPGDLLWAQETWAPVWKTEYPPDDPRDVDIQYRADWPNDKYPGHWPDDCCDDENCGRWKSSTQMPRWASRLTLEVVSVRVERLQSISEVDALAEGLRGTESQYGVETCAVDEFRMLWDAHNKKHPWSANPFVWCLEFRKVAP